MKKLTILFLGIILLNGCGYALYKKSDITFFCDICEKIGKTDCSLERIKTLDKKYDTRF